MGIVNSNLVKRVGVIEYRALSKNDTEWCAGGHLNNRKGNLADYAVYVLGKPTAFLCQHCIKEWIDAYKAIIKDAAESSERIRVKKKKKK